MSAMVSLWLLVVCIAISLYHNAYQMLTNSAVGFIGYGVGLHMDGVGGHGAWQWYVIKPSLFLRQKNAYVNNDNPGLCLFSV